MEKLFLLKDPATLARFDLLRHAADMMHEIDSEQLKLGLKGIKLTVTAYCEPSLQANSGHLWKTVRFAVRLLRSHRTKVHLNVSLTVDQTTHITTGICDSGTTCTTMILENQDEYNDAFPRIAAHIVSLLR